MIFKKSAFKSYYFMGSKGYNRGVMIQNLLFTCTNNQNTIVYQEITYQVTAAR